MRWVAVFLALAGFAVGEDDDEDAARPGLVQVHTRGDRAQKTVTAAPFVFRRERPSAAKPAEAWSWRGQFLVREEGPFRFHAYVDGQIAVRVAGRAALQRSLEQPGWVSGDEVALDYGEQPLEIDYQPGPRGEQLQLYWSSRNFPLEPLPFAALFHTAANQPPPATHDGWKLFHAHRCGACHAAERRDRPLAGPSLKHFAAGTSWTWLREKLTRTDPDPARGRMPAFGLSADDAEAALAYLAKHAESLPLPNVPAKTSDKDLAAGRDLLKSVGCLACHTWQGLGRQDVLGGGRLDDVAARRTPARLSAWLQDPGRLDRAQRMPVFNLSDAERLQIVGALRQSAAFPEQERPPTATDDALVARGQEVIAAARCAACHELPGPAIAVKMLAPIWGAARTTDQPSIGGKSCAGAPPDAAKFRPGFPQLDAHVFDDGPALHDAPVAGGAWPGGTLLEVKGCLACHDRFGQRGLSSLAAAIVKSQPQWEGQAPTLAPPPLTAVGDRQLDAALAKAIRGEQQPRMPWLKVRMPKFAHADAEAQALVSHLIERDRIPAGAPATPTYPIHAAESSADPQTLVAGRELTGGKGFNCVACHQLRDYQPPKVALGTRGSDLYGLGQRLRPEYFFRWTRSPLRILPGTEMPSYLRPHPTLLGGDLNRQLAAIWDALHDPQFTAPTNPAVVEQLLGRSPDGRPRIVRDVFTIPAENGKTESVPRAFAVGLGNGHNALFDLDDGCLRAWTIGDFARQRTQGKSWFWDLAGVPLWQSRGGRPDLYLFDTRKQAALEPQTGWEPRVRLIEYVTSPVRVTLHYALDLHRADDSEVVSVSVREDWMTRPARQQDDRDGWNRLVTVHNAPSWAEVWMRRPDPWRTFGESTTSLDAASARGARVGSGEDAKVQILVQYQSHVQPPDLTAAPPTPVAIQPERVTCLPGFDGVRLPLPRSIMPTALGWTPSGRLMFTSLKGHVYAAVDADADGLEDELRTFAEGLAAPFGIVVEARRALVAHKPEVAWFSDADQDLRAEHVRVVASGWGYTDDYHDWTSGIVQDSQGRYYIGLGSDYSHKNRPAGQSRWRGHILRFEDGGYVEPVASGLRYPIGLALLPGDRLFVSDQQGVQNTFNELDFIQLGHRYGVPAQLDPRTDEPADVAAVQIPHPWTRSVNGLAVWPTSSGHPFAGHILGCEYNERFLVRLSIQTVDGAPQGAAYPLNRPGSSNGPEELLGPICAAFGPRGDLFVGSIHDSGWLGGLNVGDIVRFTPTDNLPNGVREVRATPRGFAVDFVHPVDPALALQPDAFRLSGYTRVWEGNYATPDSGRHNVTVTGVTLSSDARTAELQAAGLKPGHVYELVVAAIGREPQRALWPATAFYTLNRLPTE